MPALRERRTEFAEKLGETAEPLGGRPLLTAPRGAPSAERGLAALGGAGGTGRALLRTGGLPTGPGGPSGPGGLPTGPGGSPEAPRGSLRARGAAAA